MMPAFLFFYYRNSQNKKTKYQEHKKKRPSNLSIINDVEYSYLK